MIARTITRFSMVSKSYGPPSCLGNPPSGATVAAGTPDPYALLPGTTCRPVTKRASGTVVCNTTWGGFRVDLRVHGVVYRNAMLHGRGGPILRCSRFAGVWERLLEANEPQLIWTVLTANDAFGFKALPRDIEILGVHHPVDRRAEARAS